MAYSFCNLFCDPPRTLYCLLLASMGHVIVSLTTGAYRVSYLPVGERQ